MIRVETERRALSFPKPMKVLHVISTLSAGGAELHLLTLCRHLKRHGVEVVVACLRELIRGSRSLRPDFERENIPIVNLRADRLYLYNVYFLSRLARLLREEQPDILHTHLPRADIATTFIRQLARSSALLCSVHGIYSRRWFGTRAAPLMRHAYRRADKIIAISAAVKDWLTLDFGVPGKKITVVHYGIEPERFASPKTDLRVTYEKGQTIVGSMGRLEVGKGFDCLIRAIPLVHRHAPGTLLLIAGYDPARYSQILQALIDRLELGGQVRLVGLQNDVPSFLHALDVFAFASRSEGFGQVVIEAMAARRPVVANRISPFTETVVHGETGLLVEPDDPQAFANAIMWLFTHPEEARQMGKRGQERVQHHFSADRMTEKTLSLYDAVLHSTRSSLLERT